MKKSFLFLLMTLSTLIITSSSCSVSKLATGELQQIKNQQASEEKGLVYFVRPTNIGGAIRFTVTADNKPIGSTQGKRFIYTQLDPGMHHFLSKAENKAELYLEIEAGKTYFIQQKVKMGIVMARNELERVSESEGRVALNKCKLSGDCPAYKSTK